MKTLAEYEDRQMLADRTDALAFDKFHDALRDFRNNGDFIEMLMRAPESVINSLALAIEQRFKTQILGARPVTNAANAEIGSLLYDYVCDEVWTEAMKDARYQMLEE